MKILVSDPLSAEGIEILKQHAEVTEKDYSDPDRLKEVIGDYDALIVRSGTKVTAEVIEAGKKLRVIGRAGVGVDNIDVPKATEKGIVVINAPEGNTISAAEHTVALITALARNIFEANASMKKGEWNRKQFLGVELNHKVLGIVGLGRIGSEVARRCRAMGMKIIAYDPYISAEQAEKIGVTMVPLEEVYRRSDFISLHLPLNNATYHLIGDEQLAMMKQGVRIVNCARGGLIDEEALCRALESGKVAGAALDVFEMEPPSQCPLVKYDNVIMTPHLGASTREAQVNVAVQVAKQVLEALNGAPVCCAVNVPIVLPDVMADINPFMPLMHLMGSLYMQVFNGSVEEVEIHYSGEIADKTLAPLTTSCLIGILEVMVGNQVNYVNAPVLARSRGIRIKEISTSNGGNFSNLITLSITTGGVKNVISGTLFNHDDMRIVQIGNYHIEVVPTRYMLICNYEDKPGVIGKVATVLGNHNINIGSMQVGRQHVGGEAVMALQLDDPIPADVLNILNEIKLIINLRFVELPERN